MKQMTLIYLLSANCNKPSIQNFTISCKNFRRLCLQLIRKHRFHWWKITCKNFFKQFANSFLFWLYYDSAKIDWSIVHTQFTLHYHIFIEFKIKWKPFDAILKFNTFKYCKFGAKYGILKLCACISFSETDATPMHILTVGYFHSACFFRCIFCLFINLPRVVHYANVKHILSSYV